MISVIVPVYNVEKYLGRCIESLIKQTCQELEIILIDDGSTDASLEICKQWEKKDQRIRVIHKENGGVSSARNLGLDVMKGEYVAFVDADDWLAENCLSEMAALMEDDVDIVNCDFEIVEEPGCQYDEFSYPDCWGKVSKDVCVRHYYESKLYMKTIWAKLYRKELWDGIRFKKLANSEDTYAMFEIIEKAQNVYLMNKKYYYYLQRTGGASHYSNQAYYQDVLVTLEYNYQMALCRYDEFREMAAQDYIQMAYALVKMFVKTGEKKKAVELIKKMQSMKKESIRKTELRSIKLLALPTMLIYMLIKLKV